MFNFLDYYKSLSKPERAKFARRANTTDGYLYAHIITRRKMPKKSTLLALVKAGRGDFTKQDLLDFFYD